MGKFLKFLLALILLPITLLVVVENLRILGGVLEHFGAAISFVLGAGVYALIHYRWYNFSRPYVFIHEMTHALVAFLCGIRIKKVSIGKESGYVKMVHTNTWVVLAPYFIPGYVILLAMLYLFLNFWLDLTPYRQIMLFLVGFGMAFHFIQTFHTLWDAEQPDLTLAGGRFFSCVTIVLANMLVLAIVLKVLFPQNVYLWEACKQVAFQISKWGQIIVHYILGKIR